MINSLYRIVFKGEAQPNKNLTTVKSRLNQLFGLNSHQLDRLFTGQPVIIKQGLEKQNALAYYRTMVEAGAIVYLQPQKTIPTTEPNHVHPMIVHNELIGDIHLPALTPPWEWLEGQLQTSLTSELQHEVTDTHALYQVPSIAIAQRKDTDQVLYFCPNSKPPFALITLHWQRQSTNPNTLFFDDIQHLDQPSKETSSTVC